MDKSYVVITDNREKTPLSFPDTLVVADGGRLSTVRIIKKSARLLTGDYLLEGYEGACIIERKKNLDEIATNCLVPRRRELFIAELERLKVGCRHPILLMEGVPQRLLEPTPTNPSPALVLDSFQRLMLRYRVPVVFCPMNTVQQRAAAGQYALHLLINGSLENAC